MATPRRDERGLALSVWLATAIVGLIVVIGIGIDFSGHARAEQHARHLAGQAARAAGQEVHFAEGKSLPKINLVAARREAAKVLSAGSYTGTVKATATGSITVEITHATYQTRFLSIIGITTLPVRATGSSEPVRALDGSQR